MRIGIDMRMAGTGEGIARYVEEVVKYLSKIDSNNDYFLLFQNRANSKFKMQNAKFRIIQVDSPYYSWTEQTRFIWELRRLKLDLVHFASFNAPVFYPGRFVTTIHDVIHHLYPGKKKSRLFHRLAYRLAIRASVKRSQKVIAVSEGAKQDILKTFKLAPEKIEVIYEGVDEIFKNRLDSLEIEQIKKKYQIKKPYLFFVGIWRQYKNLPRLAQAFDILKERYQRDYELVLAGKIDPFYPEIREAVFAARNAKEIKALGFVADEDLAALYQGAKAFVLPSLVEGFGLIGLEAQASEIPVAASNIAVLREVLGKGVVYFDPEDPEDIAAKINEILRDEEFANNLKASGKENVKKFSWEEAARKTLEVYNNAGKRN